MTSAERAPRGLHISVRTRLVIVITLVAALGMLGVGGTVLLAERQRGLERVEERLQAQLDAARLQVAAAPEGGWPDAEAALATILRMLSGGDSIGAVGLIDGDVALVPGVPLPVDPRRDAAFVARMVDETAAGEPVIGTYVDGEVTWRYLATPIDVGDGTDAVFVLVYDLDLELAAITETAQAYAVTAAVAVVVIAGVAWIAATRLLRPLREMRRATRRITALSLDDRLPVRGNDDVSDLAATVNDMLDRLDEALSSQRRLLGDVGHELKTPLTIIRGYLEVLDASDAGDVTQTRALALDELERMQALIADLLAVASLEDPMGLAIARVDVDDLVAEIVAKARLVPGARVEAGPIDAGVADLDAGRITQAVLQLVSNAVAHADGRIRIAGRRRGPRYEITVDDGGPGIPLGSRERIFERFERSTRGAGSGLGLGIVRAIAEAHGGSARAESAPGGGARVVVVFPLAGAAAGRVGRVDAGEVIDGAVAADRR